MCKVMIAKMQKEMKVDEEGCSYMCAHNCLPILKHLHVAVIAVLEIHVP